jgi:hypothetical protein
MKGEKEQERISRELLSENVKEVTVIYVYYVESDTQAMVLRITWITLML